MLSRLANIFRVADLRNKVVFTLVIIALYQIGAKPKTRGTLRALGLRGVGQTNTLPDRPEIRGMIARVPHLVTVTTEGVQS